MNITVEFEVNDRNGAPLAIGDTVELTPGGARKTIESFHLAVEIDDLAGEEQDVSHKGHTRFIYFKGGGYAVPMWCAKVQTTAERIEAVLNDTDLAFVIAMLQASDDIKRLWEATVPQYDDCYTTCPVCYGSWFDSGLGEPTQHAPDCPHEALRPLFGEES